MLGIVIMAIVLVSCAIAMGSTLGTSWDRDIGNVSQITGIPDEDWHIGGLVLDPGTWEVDWDGGYTAFQDLAGVSDGQMIITWPTTDIGSLDVVFPGPWWLVGISPVMPQQNSVGPQFAWAQLDRSHYAWGFEDLPGSVGDNDYQDGYGRLRCLDGCDPTPVPEAGTAGLLGLGLGVLTLGLAFRRYGPDTPTKECAYCGDSYYVDDESDHPEFCSWPCSDRFDAKAGDAEAEEGYRCLQLMGGDVCTDD
jgi:hypothetical protein